MSKILRDQIAEYEEGIADTSMVWVLAGVVTLIVVGFLVGLYFLL